MVLLFLKRMSANIHSAMGFNTDIQGHSILVSDASDFGRAQLPRQYIW